MPGCTADLDGSMGLCARCHLPDEFAMSRPGVQGILMRALSAELQWSSGMSEGSLQAHEDTGLLQVGQVCQTCLGRRPALEVCAAHSRAHRAWKMLAAVLYKKWQVVCTCSALAESSHQGFTLTLTWLVSQAERCGLGATSMWRAEDLHYHVWLRSCPEDAFEHLPSTLASCHMHSAIGFLPATQSSVQKAKYESGQRSTISSAYCNLGIYVLTTYHDFCLYYFTWDATMLLYTSAGVSIYIFRITRARLLLKACAGDVGTVTTESLHVAKKIS